MKRLYIILLLSLSCGRTNNKELKVLTVDRIQFPLTNPKTLTSWSDSLAKDQLDSVMRMMWSDKIMGRSILYASGYLAKFNQVNGFLVFAIQTSADDWGKSFLITAKSDLELVDYLYVTDDIGDATQDDGGNETVTGTESLTNFINDSVFVRTRLNKTIYFYRQPKESTETDSIRETFLITNQGKFKLQKTDRVRLVK